MRQLLTADTTRGSPDLPLPPCTRESALEHTCKHLLRGTGISFTLDFFLPWRLVYSGRLTHARRSEPAGISLMSFSWNEPSFSWNEPNTLQHHPEGAASGNRSLADPACTHSSQPPLLLALPLFGSRYSTHSLTYHSSSAQYNMHSQAAGSAANKWLD